MPDPGRELPRSLVVQVSDHAFGRKVKQADLAAQIPCDGREQISRRQFRFVPGVLAIAPQRLNREGEDTQRDYACDQVWMDDGERLFHVGSPRAFDE